MKTQTMTYQTGNETNVTRQPPEDYYCGRSIETKVTDDLAWAAQWALDWIHKHTPENGGIIHALADTLNAYDQSKK